ncbi:MAG: class I SAM-dependent methyltransferase [Anaerolineales bacterium]|nr:class I SAM-dependent methyltransferase [Anaerolineales bacterium]
MPLNWIDVKDLSFNTLLLLERQQLGWLPGWLPEPELAIALQANPAVAWYLQHKNPQIAAWVDGVLDHAPTPSPLTPAVVRAAEEAILRSINDLVVYAVDPEIYDRMPFLGWDDGELTGLVDFRGLTVLDIGAGTGRLAFVAAQAGAQAVFAVEPVGNLRCYIKEKARQQGLKNVFAVDGLVTDIPFPDGFADVVMGGHVFGDEPEAEYAEMRRAVKPGGLLILCPGNNDQDQGWHDFLVSQGCQWARFEEPGDGLKRKYWQRMAG